MTNVASVGVSSCGVDLLNTYWAKKIYTKIKKQDIMKNMYFKLLLLRHRLLKLLGLTNNDIIKIWYDMEAKSTCLYFYGRSGLFYITESMSNDCCSKWLVSTHHMDKYGLSKDKKNRATIYALLSVE